jgi:hypothetical protein
VTGSAAARRATTALFAALAAYTAARCALRFAFADDFDLALGKWPPSAAWLWAQHNEHRLPLVKLLLAACARHGDFRVGVWLDLAILTTTCLWIARERLVVAVLTAALLLNPESNAWRWDVELQSVLAVALFLVAFAHARTARGARDAIVVAAASLVLPLTGASGVLFSAATILAAIVLARDRTLPDRARAIFVAAALLTIAIDALWVRGWTRPAANDAYVAHSWSALASIAARLLVAPLGSVAERAPVIVALVVVAALVAIALTTTTERRAIVAIFFGGALAVLAAIAIGRAGRGWIFGLEAHYGLVIAPLYVIALVAAPPTRIAAVLAVAAIVACVLAVPTSTRESRLRERALVADCGTVPADALAARYLPLFYDADTPHARAVVTDYLTRVGCDALRR